MLARGSTEAEFIDAIYHWTENTGGVVHFV
jgi:hypothetical protein